MDVFSEQLENLNLIIVRNLILSFFLMGMLFSLTASSEQIFPDDLHCMPVLIEIPLQDKVHSEFGTGVYLEESNKLFLVTAAHCIFNVLSTNRSELINSSATLSSCIRGTNSTDRAILVLDLNVLKDEGLIKRHTNHDVAVIEIGGIFENTNAEPQDGYLNVGVRPLNLESRIVPWDANEACKTFNEVSEGTDSYVLGYPISLFIGQASEIDFASPLVRKGVISQKNQKSKKLIIDSAVYGGNSGGPVLVVEHPSLGLNTYKIVGIVTQYVPVVTGVDSAIGITNSALVNSGYGVAEPIDYALELMRQFPVTVP